MDHNQEGTHAKLGAEFCRRYGVNSIVVNAIESHHHEVDQETIEAVIVEAADAISGARPGARREDLEQYIKRLRAKLDTGFSRRLIHTRRGEGYILSAQPDANDD